MKRFLTIEINHSIMVFDDGQPAIDAVNNLNWDEYVWQFATSRYAAIKQHYEKHDLWSADQDAGRPLKDTY